MTENMFQMSMFVSGLFLPPDQHNGERGGLEYLLRSLKALK